jgi:shikimate dehydrogenase
METEPMRPAPRRQSRKIDGQTKIVGVFGAPVAHTASPAMHNAAFAALKMNWVYLPFHVEPKNLRTALTGARDMGLVGVNLTVPHKLDALEIVDEANAEARQLGAVNAVLFENRRMLGFNTDGVGFVKAILDEFNFELGGKRVLVLGAGGAGRAIAVKCILEGAAMVCVANRTVSRIDEIKQAVAPDAPLRGIQLDAGEIGKIIGEVDLLVNATSVGLQEGDSLNLRREVFSPRLYVYDTIYRPAETELLRVAAEAGAKVANGLSMLVQQGARSFEIWTKDKKAPLAKMREAARAAVYGKL